MTVTIIPDIITPMCQGYVWKNKRTLNIVNPPNPYIGQSGRDLKYPEFINRFVTIDEYDESIIHPMNEKNIKYPIHKVHVISLSVAVMIVKVNNHTSSMNYVYECSSRGKYMTV